MAPAYSGYKSISSGEHAGYILMARLENYAYFDEESVGVCLLIENKGIYGIYTVATIPKYRKQDVDQTKMKKATIFCTKLRKIFPFLIFASLYLELRNLKCTIKGGDKRLERLKLI